MKKRLWYWAVAAASSLGMAAWLTGAPDTLPVHFGISGAADAWGSKWTYLGLSFLPLILLGVFELYRRLTRDNPKIQRNRALEDRLIPAIALFFVGVTWLVASAAAGGESARADRIGAGVVGLVGVLMVYISNYLGQVRQNKTLGIRVKWTLADEEVWDRTHRLGAYAGTVGGIVILLGAVLGMSLGNAFAWCMAGLALGLATMSLIPVIYAKRLYQRRHPDER